MDQQQIDKFEQIRQGKINESENIVNYWLGYSNMSTWQFWLLLAIFVVPLLLLLWKLDRKRVLLLGFFGLNVHVWFSYFDSFGVEHGMWGYPFKIVPFLPESITLDTSLVSVTFIFLYQWCLKTQRSIVGYGIVLCALYAFMLKPIMVQLDLFHLYRGMNFFYLYLVYLAIFFISVSITKLFIYFQNHSGGTKDFVSPRLKSARSRSGMKAR